MTGTCPTPLVDGGPGMPERRYRRLVDAHFEGHPSPADERELRRHLVTCQVCRGYYDRHLLLARIVSAPARPMRAMSERLARGLGLSPVTAPSWMKRPWSMLAATGALAVGAVLLLIGLDREPDLRARGAKPGSQLLVYELAPGRSPRPVGPRLRADSGLAFAYANIGHKEHLMVFAVDVDHARRVYWYHPAWEIPAENPSALSISRDDAVHEIPEAITHHFAGRRVQLFGVFLNDTLSTREMEALVARAPADGQQRLQLRVANADVTRLDLDLVGTP